MKFDPQQHHRRSIRLRGYDYIQTGAYFVTMVTYQRAEILGAVINGVMKLSPMGEIVSVEWMRSVGMRAEILLYEDEFVIMPNHFHGIVWIVEADGVCPMVDGIHPDDAAGEEGARRAPQPELYRPAKSLGAFIAGVKAAITRRARLEFDMTGVWQRNYFEHIVRDEADLRRIRAYIQINPARWEQDQLHPAAPPNRFTMDH